MIVSVKTAYRTISVDGEESWKDISGYEGRYQVNDKGDVRRIRVKEVGGMVITKARELKKQIKNGYYGVMLYDGKNDKAKYHLVHRLVIMAFAERPSEQEVRGERLVVSHIDGNKLNNNIENLEWRSLKGSKNFRKANRNRKPITQYSTKGRFIKNWDSATEAGAALGVNPNLIGKCCRGIAKTAHGFIWKFWKAGGGMIL